jgi:TetR/AcrR family transcriptional regulator
MPTNKPQPRAKPLTPPRVKPSTAARILDSAEQRFAQRGYGATSLADIADDVSIRAPSLYKHFESKRALYIAVLDRLLAPYVELVGRLLVMPNDASEAGANLLAVVQHYMRTPNLARLVQHATLSDDEELELLVERWYGPLFARATELTTNAPYLGASKTRALSLVVSFHAMMSGYVTLGPLHARLTGTDPYGDEAVNEQLTLMAQVAMQLWRVEHATPEGKPHA